MELLVLALCLLILALSAVGISIAAVQVMRPSVRLVQTYQKPRPSRRRQQQHQKRQQEAHQALQARLVERQTKLDRELQRRLFSMTIDQATALRLVEGLKDLEPGRPENWYWEKAIDDLERDRR